MATILQAEGFYDYVGQPLSNIEFEVLVIERDIHIKMSFRWGEGGGKRTGFGFVAKSLEELPALVEQLKEWWGRQEHGPDYTTPLPPRVFTLPKSKEGE